MTDRGTRVFWRSGDRTVAEMVTGQVAASGFPRPRWADDPDRPQLPCQQPEHEARRNRGIDWWFAPSEEPGHETSQREANLAIALCGLCPLQLDCREDGLRHRKHGIWGGVRVDNLKAATRRDLLAKLERERRRQAS